MHHRAHSWLACSLLGGLLSLSLGSCGSNEKVCAPGATQVCACSGGTQGVQVCATSGATWETCQCGAIPGDGGVKPGQEGGPPPGDGPTTPREQGTANPDGPPPQPGKLPIMIPAGHYVTYRSQLLSLGPFLVYGWAADPALNFYDKEIQTLQGISDPGITKMMLYSSYQTLQSKLGDASHVTQLKSIGVSVIGYNTEGDKTPSSEFNNLTQAVSQFATLSASKGFRTVWGPIRPTADTTSDGAYTQMLTAGLSGLALQEQKPIEESCVPARVSAVKQTSSRVKGLSAGKPFEVQVQVMPSRCLSGDTYAKQHCGTSGGKFFHCLSFLDQLKSVVDVFAIWSSSPEDNSELVNLIQGIRK